MRRALPDSLLRITAAVTAFAFLSLQLFAPLARAEENPLPTWLREEQGGWVPAEQAQRMQRADQDLLTHLSALEQAQQRFITTHPSGLEVQYADQEAVVARDSAGNLLWAPTLDDYRKVQNGTLLLVDGTLQVVKNGQLVREVDAAGNEAVFRADGRVDHEIAADGTRTDYAYSETGFTRTTHNPNGDRVQEYNTEGRLVRETTPEGTVSTYSNGILSTVSAGGVTFTYTSQAVADGTVTASLSEARDSAGNKAAFAGGRIATLRFSDGTLLTNVQLDPTGKVTAANVILSDGTRQTIAGGTLTSVLTINGRMFDYNTGWLRTLSKNGQSTSFIYTLNASGGLSTVTAQASDGVARTYNAGGRLVETLRPDGTVETFLDGASPRWRYFEPFNAAAALDFTLSSGVSIAGGALRLAGNGSNSEVNALFNRTWNRAGGETTITLPWMVSANNSRALLALEGSTAGGAYRRIELYHDGSRLRVRTRAGSNTTLRATPVSSVSLNTLYWVKFTLTSTGTAVTVWRDGEPPPSAPAYIWTTVGWQPRLHLWVQHGTLQINQVTVETPAPADREPLAVFSQLAQPANPYATDFSIRAARDLPAVTLTYSGQPAPVNVNAPGGLWKTNSWPVTRDTLPPTGILEMPALTDQREITLTLSALDPAAADGTTGSGVRAMRFSFDRGATWSDPEPFAAGKTVTLPEQNGDYTIQAQFQDAAGSWSKPVARTIMLRQGGSTLPPVLSLLSAETTDSELYDFLFAADEVVQTSQRWRIGRGRHLLIASAANPSGIESWAGYAILRSGEPLPEPTKPLPLPEGSQVTQTLTDGSVALFIEGTLVSVTTPDGTKLLRPALDETGRITGGWLITPDGTTTFLQGSAAVWSKNSFGAVTWYFPDGRPEAVRGKDGTMTAFAYRLDDAGQVATALITTGNTSTLVDAADKPMMQLRADGSRLSYTRGRLSAVESTGQPAIRYTESVQTDGSIVSEHPGSAATDLPRRWVYEADGSLREVTQTDGTVIRFSAGIPTESVAADGTVTVLTGSDPAGSDPFGFSVVRNGVTRLYSGQGSLSQLTLSDQTRLTFNGENLAGVSLADGTRVSNGVYDADSKLISGVVTLPDGRVVRYAGGQPVEATLPDGSHVNYSAGAPAGLTLPSGSTYTLTHETNRWVAALTPPSEGTPASDSLTRMVYSEEWALQEATRADGAQMAYADGLLSALTQANGTVISYAYDAAGRLASTVAASPDPAEPVIRTEYAYDRIRKVYKGNTLIYEYSYEFDADGNETTTLRDLQANRVKRYRDGLLISQTDPDGAVTTYEYTTNPAGYFDPLAGVSEAVQTLPDKTVAHYLRQGSSWQLVRLTLRDGTSITNLANLAVAGQVAQATLPQDPASLFRIERLGILRPAGASALSLEDSLPPAQEKSLSFLAGRQITNGEYTGLVPSYAQVPAEDPLAGVIRDRGYTYDQAMTAIALAAAGKTPEARKMLEALERLENGSGRLGFSYPLTSTGQQNPALFSGTLAWAGMAGLFYLQQTGDARFLPLAERLAQTLLSFQDPLTGLIKGGLSAEGAALAWTSTEHNVESYFFLRELGTLTGKGTYSTGAGRIGEGILARLRQEDHFKRGLGDDAVMLDTQALGALFLLAVDRREEALRVRAFIEENFLRTVEIGGQPVTGYAPYALDPFVWTEGSFLVGALDRRLGDRTAAERISQQMETLQDPSGGGIRYASGRAVTQAPEDGATYTDFPSSAATAWHLLENLNPSGLLDAAAPAAAGAPRVSSAALSQAGKIKERFTYRYEAGLSHVTDDAGTTRSYDAFNQLAAVEQPGGTRYQILPARELSTEQQNRLDNLDPSDPEVTRILRNPEGEQITLHRLTRLALQDGTIQTDDFPADTLIEREFDGEGRLLTQTQANGQVTLYEEGRPTQTLDADGNVTTRFTYNEAGQLVKSTLHGARREVAEQTAAARAEVIRKRADALEELAERKQLAIGQIAEQTTQARAQLQAQLADLGQTLGDLENTDVRGKKAKRQKGQALDQIRHGMNQVRDALSSLDQQYSQVLGGLESQVESVRNELESQSASAFVSITAKQEEFTRAILRQEIASILLNLYRETIGRDPSPLEMDAHVERLFQQFGTAPEARLDVEQVQAEIRGLPDYSERVEQVAQIQTALNQRLDAWLAANETERRNLLAPYGVTPADTVPLDAAAAARIRQWLAGNSLHFGHSAFLPLQSLLAQASGITVDTATLAAESIWLDIVTGTITSSSRGDLELSLFSLQHVAQRHGLELFAARVGFDDLQGILPLSRESVQAISPDGKTAYQVRPDGVLEAEDLQTQAVTETTYFHPSFPHPTFSLLSVVPQTIELRMGGVPVGGSISTWVENDVKGESGIWYIQPLNGWNTVIPPDGYVRATNYRIDSSRLFRPGHTRIVLTRNEAGLDRLRQYLKSLHPWVSSEGDTLIRQGLYQLPNGKTAQLHELDQILQNQAFVEQIGLIVLDVAGDGSLTALPGSWDYSHIDTGAAPTDAVITPDGKTLWTLLLGDRRTHSTLIGINLQTMQVEKVLSDIGASVRLAISPDGTILYLHDRIPLETGSTTASSLRSLSASTGQLIRQTSLPVAQISDWVVHPDGTLLAVTPSPTGSRLLWIDPQSLEIRRQQEILSENPFEAAALRPDGQQLYLLESSAGRVVVLDTSTGAIVQEIPIYQPADDIFFSSDGTVIYLLRKGTGIVLRLDAASHQPVTTDPTGPTLAQRLPTAPVMALINGHHYVHLIGRRPDGSLLVYDPNKGPDGTIDVLTAQEFRQVWNGYILSPRGPPHAYQLLTQQESQEITGAFIPALIAIFAAIAAAIGTAIAAIVSAVAAVLAVLASTLSAIFTAIGTAFSSIGTFFGGFGSLFSGAGLVGQGFSALFAGQILGGLSLIGQGLLTAVGLSSFSWASLGQFALTTAVNVGVSRGLEALGVSPTIASLAGAFTSGGISGALNPVSTTSSFLTKFVAGALTSTAVAGTQLGLVKAGLDPALANIAGIGVGTITNSLATSGLSGLGNTLRTQLAPTLTGELAFYGVQKLGESISLDPRISQLAGMPIKAGIGNIANPATRGQGIVNSMWEGLKSGVTAVGVNMATQALGLDPFAGSLVSRTLSGAISGAISPSHNVFQGVYDAFRSSVGNFSTIPPPPDPKDPRFIQNGVWNRAAYEGAIGQYEASRPVWMAQTMAKTNNFSDEIRQYGLAQAMENYATSIFHRDSVESLVQSFGSIKNAITQRMQQNKIKNITLEDGTQAKKLSLFDNKELSLLYKEDPFGNTSLLGITEDELERRYQEIRADRQTNTAGMTQGTITRPYRDGNAITALYRCEIS